ncbi:LysR substrate-binding domain-containing protein [Schauerella aestuarii]|uniref:LysR substrate-binding domain-containing protein n=1 Tax=Schauerella aestuarii TaxID=2511204 RepID=UPI00136D9B12|nr:LysR substrate-binding domain-containing protein [Achromobacter aestuarii]MYZ43605.1 LysR family transcriptional regulator [Achromobacter aestuarii]
MNFKQIEAFRTVMISGSASLAADLLQVSQPAISRSIQELEKSLGFSLFDRIRGRLVPTAEGQLFFRDVTASFIGLDHLRASAARIREFGSGEIRLASLSALGATLVPKALKRFFEQHPGTAVTLQIMTSSAIRDLVAEGRFDVGLAADEIDISGIDHQTFTTPAAVCAIPAAHPLAQRAVIRPQDLDGQRFIALSPEDTVRRQLNEVCDQAGVRPVVVVETPNSATVCALAMEGVGIGLTNPYATDGYGLRGVVFRPFAPAIHFKSLLIFRPDMRKSRIVRDLVKALMAARNARAGQDRGPIRVTPD